MIFSRSVTPRELIYMRLQRWLSFSIKMCGLNIFKSVLQMVSKNNWTDLVQIKFFLLQH